MPTYEFACYACGALFDEVRPIANRNDPAQCKCGAIAVREIRTPAMGQPDIKPYIAQAGDRAGKPITSRREHKEFLKRNRLVEAADVKPPERGKHLPFPKLGRTDPNWKAKRRRDLRDALRQHVPQHILDKRR